MKIPSYPGSREPELGDKQLFDSILAEIQPEICEYTFANLYAWRKLYDFSVSMYNDFVVLSAASEGSPRSGLSRYFFEPLGKGDKVGVIRRLAGQKGAEFRFLSEELKKVFEDDKSFAVSLDKENGDYVYNSSDLITLKGKKYDGKRNFIKRFKADNQYAYIPLSGGNAKNCIAFAEEWCKFRDCEGVESLKFESLAIREMLENFSVLGLSGGAIEIGGKVCALGIGEKLKADTFVVHILKAKDGITGLNQTMNNEFLAREAAGFKFVNMEQDLGLEGLRKSKLSYHPVKMINKYVLKSI